VIFVYILSERAYESFKIGWNDSIHTFIGESHEHVSSCKRY
jgi:hypothetical protein